MLKWCTRHKAVGVVWKSAGSASCGLQHGNLPPEELAVEPTHVAFIGSDESDILADLGLMQSSLTFCLICMETRVHTCIGCPFSSLEKFFYSSGDNGPCQEVMD